MTYIKHYATNSKYLELGHCHARDLHGTEVLLRHCLIFDSGLAPRSNPEQIASRYCELAVESQSRFAPARRVIKNAEDSLNSTRQDGDETGATFSVARKHPKKHAITPHRYLYLFYHGKWWPLPTCVQPAAPAATSARPVRYSRSGQGSGRSNDGRISGESSRPPFCHRRRQVRCF